jgi:hypothetical protein
MEYRAYLLRIWRDHTSEADDGRAGWRIVLQPVQGEQKITLRTPDELAAYLSQSVNETTHKGE